MAILVWALTHQNAAFSNVFPHTCISMKINKSLPDEVFAVRLFLALIDSFLTSFINFRLVKERGLTNFSSQENDQLLMTT